MRLLAAVASLAVLSSCTCGNPNPNVTDSGCQPSELECGACGVRCPADQACANAQCWPKDCAGAACLPSQVCPADVCVEKACAGVVCPAGQICAQGACVPAACGGNPCPPGQACIGGVCVDAACVGVICPAGAVCQAGACVAPGCFDRVKTGDETDVDCGGASCPGCGAGQVCALPRDCASRACTSGRCVAPTGCGDAKKNGSETGTDCGGPACNPCGGDGGCGLDRDCVSMMCGPGGVCLGAPSCTDGRTNGSETGVDCGGPTTCPRCPAGGPCHLNSDCIGGMCSVNDGGAGTCQVSPCSNGQTDPPETDVDCGGPACPKCALNQTCGTRADCQSNACVMGRCVAQACNDLMTNGAETDVDCGGGTCPGCAAGRVCLLARDCDSQVCDGGRCSAPTCTDNARNGSEVGVDCGGTCYPCGLSPPTYLPTCDQPRDVVAADFDSDGRQDFAVNCVNDATLAVYLGNGDGTFKPRQNHSTVVNQSHMVGGRIDMDNLTDLVLTNPGAPGIGLYVMLGRDGGTFTSPIPYAGATGYIPKAAIGDLDGDGRNDVLVGGVVQPSVTQDAVNVLKGRGNGSFDPAQKFPVSCCATEMEAIGNVNGDAYPDVVALGTGAAVALLPGLPGGQLGAAQTVDNAMAGNAGPYVTLLDLSGDSRDEIVEVSSYLGVRVFVNNGDGGFAAPMVLATQPNATAGAPGGLVTGRIDGDSNVDVVVPVNFTSQGICVFLGTGTGLLTGPTFYPGNVRGDAALADFNGDGKNDVVFTGTGNTVGVMLNRY